MLLSVMRCIQCVYDGPCRLPNDFTTMNSQRKENLKESTFGILLRCNYTHAQTRAHMHARTQRESNPKVANKENQQAINPLTILSVLNSAGFQFYLRAFLLQSIIRIHENYCWK